MSIRQKAQPTAHKSFVLPACRQLAPSLCAASRACAPPAAAPLPVSLQSAQARPPPAAVAVAPSHPPPRRSRPNTRALQALEVPPVQQRAGDPDALPLRAEHYGEPLPQRTREDPQEGDGEHLRCPPRRPVHVRHRRVVGQRLPPPLSRAPRLIRSLARVGEAGSATGCAVARATMVRLRAAAEALLVAGPMRRV